MFLSSLLPRNLLTSTLQTSSLKLFPALSSLRPRLFASDSNRELPLSYLNEEDQMLVEQVSKFAKEKIGPKVKEMDEKAQMDSEVLKELFEQGLMGIEIPEEYGGAGFSFVSACLVIEELAKVDAAVSVLVDVQNTLVNNAFLAYGSEFLKKKYLPRLATDTVGSFCLTEANAGSDAFALETLATKKGNEYVLNGSKLWITNAKEAGVYIIMANADPSKKHRGITAFVVERDNPGLTIGKKEDKLGIRASSTCEVVLQDCVVPEENVLGEVGKGYKIAIEVLNEGRIGIASQMIGIAQGAFDAALPYIHERKQFGHPVANFQGMQFQYADAATQIHAARLMVFEAARRREAGMDFIKEAAMAKLYTSEVAQEVAAKAVEWMGGFGFVKEYDAEKYYRDSIIGKIYEGTSNIQRFAIAKILQSKYK